MNQGKSPPKDVLVVGTSSSALFNLSESDRIFREEGAEAYARHQRERENKPPEPGAAFPLVKKLLALNVTVKRPVVEVILLSRNSADTGLRLFNAIEEYGLEIKRAAFCSGASPYRYVRSFGCQLFLSMDPGDVSQALGEGVAAAQMMVSESPRKEEPAIHFAFDADAVVFSDEAEAVFQTRGLDYFRQNESHKAEQPLQDGPFTDFLHTLQALQSQVSPGAIRTALVTARDAPAHKRVILTLRHLGLRIDEILFLGGQSKGEFLRAFGADIFFDDQQQHCDAAVGHTAVGHVPYGTMNEERGETQKIQKVPTMK